MSNFFYCLDFPCCHTIIIFPENSSILHRKNKQKLQILEALYKKINKPSFNKIDFECNNHIQPLALFLTILPLVKIFSSLNSSPTCSSSNSLYKCIGLIITLVISLFFPPKWLQLVPKVCEQNTPPSLIHSIQKLNDSYKYKIGMKCLSNLIRHV